MFLGQVARRKIDVLEEGDTLNRAASIFSVTENNCIPIVKEGKPVGILTLHRLIDFLAKQYDLYYPVREAMQLELITVSAELKIEDVSQLPLERLLVVDKQGSLIGIVTKMDLIGQLYHKLQETQLELQAILDSAPIGIVAANADGNITIMNLAAEAILGIKAKNIIGDKLSWLCAKLGWETVLKNSTERFTEIVKFNENTLALFGNPIKKNDTIQGLVTSIQDVSELISAHEELRIVKQLNKELDSVIGSSYDGIIVTDAEKVLRVNSSFERISGLKREELVGLKVEEFDKKIHICLESIRTVFTSVLKERKPCTVLRKLRGNDIYVTGSPIADEKGKLMRIIINVRDITELNVLKEKVETAENLTARYRKELEELRARVIAQEEMIFESEEMKRVLELVIRVAQVDSTVLIQGESGVGKEVVAKLMHRLSQRKEKPFIQINCGAIPDNLLESELFGYEGGSFTGAKREGKIGLFELANEGILFLDEISEIPLNLQVKLLRAIQEQEIYRVGGLHPIRLNLRIIAASNKNLQELVENNTFREDLYYRLSVVPIFIPPLRKRRQDIIPLTFYFLRKFNQKYQMQKTITPEVCQMMINYDWPGNVRELQNIIERMVVLSEGEVICPEYLPPIFLPSNRLERSGGIKVDGLMPLIEGKEQLERILITRALESCNSIREAAQLLGIDHSTCIRKIQKYGLNSSIRIHVV